jgi:hypothetical protein
MNEVLGDSRFWLPSPMIQAMSSLSSRTRSGPAGFIEPCLPSPADKPPSGANRIHEWLKFKNPVAPAVKREAEEDWSR